MAVFKFYAEWAMDPKVQMMGEADQRRLVMLFCLQATGDLEGIDDESIAHALRITVDQALATKALFLKKGFIAPDWSLVNWEKRQGRSANAVKCKRYRDRQKGVADTVANGVATPTTTPHTTRVADTVANGVAKSVGQGVANFPPVSPPVPPPISPRTESNDDPSNSLSSGNFPAHAGGGEIQPKFDPNSPEARDVLSQVVGVFQMDADVWGPRFSAYLGAYPADWVRELIPVIHAAIEKNRFVSPRYGWTILESWKANNPPGPQFPIVGRVDSEKPMSAHQIKMAKYDKIINRAKGGD